MRDAPETAAKNGIDSGARGEPSKFRPGPIPVPGPIERIRITNFQCHETVDITLSPSVNTLSGRSGIGKSALLIRPLRWLVFGYPSGDSFRRWGSDKTGVEIWVDNGIRIGRFRTNKSNWYEIEYSGEETLILKVGSDRRIPESVSSLINLSDINFQFQHDPHYLLGLKPLELARTMNQIAGMEDIDVALSKANSRFITEQTKARLLGDEVARCELDVAQYQGLDELDVSVIIVEEMENEIGNHQRRRDGISRYSAELSRAKLSLDQYRLLPELSEDVNRAVGTEREIAESTVRADRIRELVHEATRLSGVLDQCRGIDDASIRVGQLESLPRRIAEAQRRAGGIAALVDKYLGIGKLVNDYQVLPTLLDEYQATAEIHTAMTIALSRSQGIAKLVSDWVLANESRGGLVTEIGALYSEFDTLMPERCPLCDRGLDD